MSAREIYKCFVCVREKKVCLCVYRCEREGARKIERGRESVYVCEREIKLSLEESERVIEKLRGRGAEGKERVSVLLRESEREYVYLRD